MQPDTPVYDSPEWWAMAEEYARDAMAGAEDDQEIAEDLG